MATPGAANNFGWNSEGHLLAEPATPSTTLPGPWKLKHLQIAQQEEAARENTEIKTPKGKARGCKQHSMGACMKECWGQRSSQQDLRVPEGPGRGPP